MAKAYKIDFNDPAPIDEEEDHETLAAIEEGIRDAQAGCTVPIEHVRGLLPKWITASFAQKSTGPRSIEGKLHSSQNALKSGIDAESLVIRGEDRAALEALTQQYLERFQPATPEQRHFGDSPGHAHLINR
jgi:hypothetical protein